MANDAKRPPAPEALLERKLALLKRMLSLSQRQLLLVNIDELGEVLAQKDRLIGEVQRIDKTLASSGHDPLADPEPALMRAEFARVIEAILSNEGTMGEHLQNKQTTIPQ